MKFAKSIKISFWIASIFGVLSLITWLLTFVAPDGEPDFMWYVPWGIACLPLMKLFNLFGIMPVYSNTLLGRVAPLLVILFNGFIFGAIAILVVKVSCLLKANSKK